MKGIMLSLLLLAVVSITSAEKCRTFKCKGWFTPMDEDVCVQINPDSGSKQPVRKCENGKACEANGWFTTEAATKNAYCKEWNNDPIVNKTMPGDYCDKDSECYGQADKVSCDRGVCQTTVQIGDSCDTSDPEHPGGWACPVGSYCDTEERKCAPQLKEGEVCIYAYECWTGFNCVKVNYDSESKCTRYWSLEDGDTFDPIGASVRDIILPLASICKSNWAFRPDEYELTYECRQAPFNNNVGKLSDLKRTEGPGSDCDFTVFDDLYDYSKPVQKIGKSYCGFNKDSASYCNKQMGDEWFQRLLRRIQSADWPSINCHPSAMLFQCSSFNQVISKDLYLKFFRELISVPEGIFVPDGVGYALYANNDKCVADSITEIYWQGEKPHYEADTNSVIAESI